MFPFLQFHSIDTNAGRWKQSHSKLRKELGVRPGRGAIFRDPLPDSIGFLGGEARRGTVDPKGMRLVEISEPEDAGRSYENLERKMRST